MNSFSEIEALIRDSINENSSSSSISFELLYQKLQDINIISSLVQILTENLENSVKICCYRCIKLWISLHNSEIDIPLLEFIYSKLFAAIFGSYNTQIIDLLIHIIQNYDFNKLYYQYIIILLENLEQINRNELFGSLSLLLCAFSDQNFTQLETDYFSIFCFKSLSLLDLSQLVEFNNINFDIYRLIFKIINTGIKRNYQFDGCFIEKVFEFISNMIDIFYQNPSFITNGWKLLSYCFKLNSRFIKFYLFNDENETIKYEFVSKLLAVIPQTFEAGIFQLMETLIFSIKSFSNYLPQTIETFDLIILSGNLMQMTIESFNEAPLSFFTCVYPTNGDLKFSYMLAYKFCSINIQFFEYLLSLPPSEANQRFVANLYSKNLNFDREILKDYIISAVNAAEEPIEISTSIYLLIKCIDCFSDSELSEISNSIVLELFSMNEYDVILCMACKLCTALSIRSIELPAEVIPILVELTNSIVSKYSSKALCSIAQHFRSNLIPVASDILNILFETIEIDLKSYAEEEDIDENLDDLIRKRANSIIELLKISKIPIEDEKIIQILVNLQNYGFSKKFIRLCIVIIKNHSPISSQIAHIIFESLNNNKEAQKFIDLYLEALMQLILVDPATFCASINVDELILYCLSVFTTSKNFSHYCSAADMLSWCILQHCHGNNSQIIFRTVSEASNLGNHQFISDLVLISLQIAGENILNEEDFLRFNDYVLNEYIIRLEDIVLFIELYSRLNNVEIVNILKSQIKKFETLSKPEMELVYDNIPLCFQLNNSHDVFPLKNMLFS